MTYTCYQTEVATDAAVSCRAFSWISISLHGWMGRSGRRNTGPKCRLGSHVGRGHGVSDIVDLRLFAAAAWLASAWLSSSSPSALSSCLFRQFLPISPLRSKRTPASPWLLHTWPLFHYSLLFFHPAPATLSQLATSYIHTYSSTHTQMPKSPTSPPDDGDDRHRSTDIVARKKKNADAQAAFRQRRATYISSLEETGMKLNSRVIFLNNNTVFSGKNGRSRTSTPNLMQRIPHPD